MNVEVFNIAEITPETKEQKLQFRKFKKDEQAVYEMLCPSKNTLKSHEIIEMPDLPDRVKEMEKNVGI
ncbi:MAG TPA: hypothetical protein VLJ10_02255 [Candidatus Bathyarchaeia archaeon]|nr:hypothetical protein [Candidatus Bathyarchaeia archaeon]